MNMYTFFLRKLGSCFFEQFTILLFVVPNVLVTKHIDRDKLAQVPIVFNPKDTDISVESLSMIMYSKTNTQNHLWVQF